MNNRFAVLTGHLNDYPLSDLIGVLRHQRKTGRLLIEYQKGPAFFYFNEGDLVDAQLGDLCGLQAICVAMGQPPGAFNFNPLIRPSKRSIENSLQRVVSELVGCWDESVVQIDALSSEGTAARSLVPSPLTAEGIVPEERRPLALPGFVAQGPLENYSRIKLTMIAGGLILLGLSAGIAVSGEFGNTTESSSQSSSLGTTRQAVESIPPEKISGARTSSRIESAVRRENPNSREAGTVQATRNKKELPEPTEKVNEASVPGVASAVEVDRPEDKSKVDNASNENTPDARSIKVVMQIENGRVLNASVSKSHAGMESYEAMALRIARQRRYPAQIDGQETVTIRVSQP